MAQLVKCLSHMYLILSTQINLYTVVHTCNPCIMELETSRFLGLAGQPVLSNWWAPDYLRGCFKQKSVQQPRKAPNPTLWTSVLHMHIQYMKAWVYFRLVWSPEITISYFSIHSFIFLLIACAGTRPLSLSYQGEKYFYSVILVILRTYINNIV